MLATTQESNNERDAPKRTNASSRRLDQELQGGNDRVSTCVDKGWLNLLTVDVHSPQTGDQVHLRCVGGSQSRA